jgi:hypothetical protein
LHRTGRGGSPCSAAAGDERQCVGRIQDSGPEGKPPR